MLEYMTIKYKVYVFILQASASGPDGGTAQGGQVKPRWAGRYHRPGTGSVLVKAWEQG
jgi:hypothetical protein